MTNYNVYQIDIQGNKLLNSYENKFKSLEYVNAKSNPNYFYSNWAEYEGIYIFNELNKAFELLTYIPTGGLYDIEIHGDYIIFKCESSPGIKRITVYNTSTKEKIEYKNVEYYTIDNNVVYMITENHKIIKEIL